ncbi:hypothetical protein PR048_012468 [Dryococelus australis]|uniref:Uncharacterized protein n=1 Tax=Dryococelus australis TaxID=614101 RepID=A0ABQ9HPG7_9NEOP|nr:hypothetical protein PR048_012468 [Dryococelus australis]
MCKKIKTILKCICFKAKHIQPIKVFHFCNAHYIKVYLCVLIFFATKAVHLEVVSAVITNTFLNAFNMFLERRNWAQDVHIDCKIPFFDAHHQLAELLKKT